MGDNVQLNAENYKAYQIFQAWRNDPELFANEALCFKQKGIIISTQQKQLLKSVRDLVFAKIKAGQKIKKLTPKEKKLAAKIGISVMSGTGTGKDGSTTWIVLWFLTCFSSNVDKPKVICTANTGNQLKDVLWSEFHKWLKGSLIESFFVYQSDKIYWKEEGGSEWWAVARTVNSKGSDDEQAETLAGRHSNYMMFVIDEASGIPEPVFRPIEGGLTGLCNFVLMIFNPTRARGFAVESHEAESKNDWIALRWNAEESELVTDTSIERLKRKYGINSNVYRMRVLGLPPTKDKDALISWDWIEDAALIDIEQEEVEGQTVPIVFGVDVAVGGEDKSAIAIRKGHTVLDVFSYDFNDTMLLVDEVVKLADVYKADFIYVDIIGVGVGVHDRLKQLLGKIVRPVDSRRRAVEVDKYANLRAELCWRVRAAFEDGLISIPNIKELKNEISIIKNFFDKRGRNQIVGKPEYRAKGIPSPNMFDAVVNTFATKLATVKFKKRDRWAEAFERQRQQELDNNSSWMGV